MRSESLKRHTLACGIWRRRIAGTKAQHTPPHRSERARRGERGNRRQRPGQPGNDPFRASGQPPHQSTPCDETHEEKLLLCAETNNKEKEASGPPQGESLAGNYPKGEKEAQPGIPEKPQGETRDRKAQAETFAKRKGKLVREISQPENEAETKEKRKRTSQRLVKRNKSANKEKLAKD